MTGKARIFFMTVCFFSSMETKAYDITHNTNIESRLRTFSGDKNNEKSKAASILIRLGLNSEWRENIQTHIELDHVSTIWQDEHNNQNNVNNKANIPDTPGTEINQAYIQIKSNQFTLKTGRQRIEMDNQRFIGSNSFWQSDQTFDAISSEYTFLNASNLQYSYIANANRIFGNAAGKNLNPNDPRYSSSNTTRPKALLGDHEHKTHILHATFNEWDYSDITTYYYHINNIDNPNVSNKTLGSSYTFKRRLASFLWRVELEAASQHRYKTGDNTRKSYWRTELGFGINSFEVSLRGEELQSKNGRRFVTPLSSSHNFHGWADRFSNTPEIGIKDRSIQLTWRKSPVKIDTRYHFFNSSEGNIDWGQEWDIDVITKITRNQKILVRYADYRASSVSRIQFPSEKRAYLNYTISF